MKIVIWIVSALLALVFLVIGGMKLLASTADLTTSAPDVPVALMRIAGLAEVLGALGLILPAATRILPILTPVAAVGLSLTMVGAIITNIAIGMAEAIVLPVVLLVLCAGIAWLRFGRYAVAPRAAGGPVPSTENA